MSNYKIDFDHIPWHVLSTNSKQKIVNIANQRIRLLKLEAGFKEQDWCTRSHIGYVLEGALKIEFDCEIITLKKGDGLNITDGIEHKHRAIIETDGFAVLILFEEE